MSGPKISKMHARVKATKEEREIADALKENPPAEPFWDMAEQFYQDAIHNVAKTNSLVADHLRDVMADPEKKEKIADKETLAKNIKTLSEDIGKHVETLGKIHERHEGRSGGIKTPDDFMLLTTINGEYRDANEMFTTITMPLVTEIMENTGAMSNVVEEAIRQQVEKQHREREEELKKAQNPDIVTDVVVKPVEDKGV